MGSKEIDQPTNNPQLRRGEGLITKNNTEQWPQAQQRPSVGAVVVNYNDEKRILKTLSALFNQDYPLQHVIVVDNGSADGSPSKIREHFPAATLIELGHNLGLSTARNRGLNALTTDLALLLDSDVYAQVDCLSLLVSAQQQEQAVLVCPRIRLFPERDTVQAEGAEIHFIGTMALRHAYLAVDQISPLRTEVNACIGACMLVDRQAVLTEGGFDELYFFYFEDLEFSLRLKAMGHKIVCEPAAQVVHDRGKGTVGLSFRGTEQYPQRRVYLVMRHRLLTLFIHFQGRTLFTLFPVLLLYEVATLSVALFQGWFRQCLSAYVWLFENRATIIQRRQVMQQRRVCSDAAILTGGPLPFAPGFIRSPVAKFAANLLSSVCDGYWRVVRRWIP